MPEVEQMRSCLSLVAFVLCAVTTSAYSFDATPGHSSIGLTAQAEGIRERPDDFSSGEFLNSCRPNCTSEGISQSHKCSIDHGADISAFNTCMEAARNVQKMCIAQCDDMGG
jgi:hypothetical protein